MQLSIIDEAHIQLRVDGQNTLVLAEPPGALHLLGASLALCTAAVLHEYATTAQFALEPCTIEVRWQLAEQPRRVEHFMLRLLVEPHVPPSRHAALLRAAEHCTVHQTLTRGTMINAMLEVCNAQQA